MSALPRRPRPGAGEVDPTRLRIVHVITTLGVGGAEKHLLWLGEGQRRAGHEVHVVYLKGKGELVQEFLDRGVQPHRVPMEGLLRAPAALLALTRLLRRLRPDVVHTHLLKADAVGSVAARRARAPSVISSKHNDERALLRPAVGVVHGLLMRRVDRVVALSDHVARFVAEHGRVPPDRIRRIYYGVDATQLVGRRTRAQVRAELGLSEQQKVLVCVGRLAPQKDHPTLLAAMAKLPADVRLLVVGGDPFGDGEARLATLAAQLGVSERVHFLGIRHDVPDLLTASDLFVLPSLWEGLGLVFLEAMAVALPIVASNVSAIPEVVEDGVSGWLVPPGDPDALAGAVQRALGDPAARHAAGLAGHMRLLERFALPRMIDETLSLYRDVLWERQLARADRGRDA
ncbi:MAG: glycosyltransferase [Planctomycetes bacterium]|nr:glycosyltransferase [Planctomycetota bacterium]